MPIVTAKEVASGLKLDKLGWIGTCLGWFIIKLLEYLRSVGIMIKLVITEILILWIIH